MTQKYLITARAEILYTGTFNTTKEVIKLQKGDELNLTPIGSYELTKNNTTYEFKNQSMNWFLQGHVGSYKPIGQDEPQDIFKNVTMPTTGSHYKIEEAIKANKLDPVNIF